MRGNSPPDYMPRIITDHRPIAYFNLLMPTCHYAASSAVFALYVEHHTSNVALHYLVKCQLS